MSNKILVVDDERMIRDVYQAFLERAGYTVRCAESSEQALDILGEESFNVMFLDLKLPGVNGIELCRQIRRKLPIAVIYAVTGYMSVFELSECREAGFDDYFMKPVDLETLLKAARDAFEKVERWKKR